MINVTNITKAMHSILEDAPLLQGIKRIVRGDTPNNDPSFTPWLGVYRRRVVYDPHSIGGSRSWKANVEIALMLQVANIKSGENVEDIIEEYIQNINAVLLENKKLNNTVDQLVGFSIEYFFNDENEPTFTYQQAEIVVTYEVRT